MTRPIHMMIRALDAERSLDFYRRAFDLNITGRFAFDDFELIYLNDKPGAFEIELTVNRGRTNAYDLGDGYGHVAFVVDDIASEHARFEREGLHPGPLKEMQRNGKQFARFFFVQDPDGYKIEVLQKSGRFA
jgi:lactoylglutathione lyase